MTDPPIVVLIVDDEPDVRMALRAVLGRAGFQVVQAIDGSSALEATREHHPQVVLLDVGLPVMNGWEVLPLLREISDVPVLMLTARGQEADKVQGLELGADDYVTKPFGNDELVARVHALLRRAPAQTAAALDRYQDDWVTIDIDAHRVDVGGEQVHLTATEFRLLLAFVRHPDQVLTPTQLLAFAWDDPLGIGPERVKFTLGRLRKALGVGTDLPIQSVRGVGYRYVPRR